MKATQGKKKPVLEELELCALETILPNLDLEKRTEKEKREDQFMKSQGSVGRCRKKRARHGIMYMKGMGYVPGKGNSLNSLAFPSLRLWLFIFAHLSTNRRGSSVLSCLFEETCPFLFFLATGCVQVRPSSLGGYRACYQKPPQKRPVSSPRLDIGTYSGIGCRRHKYGLKICTRKRIVNITPYLYMRNQRLSCSQVYHVAGLDKVVQRGNCRRCWPGRS